MFASDPSSPGCSEANTPTLRTQLSLEVLIMWVYDAICFSPVQQQVYAVQNCTWFQQFQPCLATSCNGAGIESLLKVRTCDHLKKRGIVVCHGCVECAGRMSRAPRQVFKNHAQNLTALHLAKVICTVLEVQ